MTIAARGISIYPLLLRDGYAAGDVIEYKNVNIFDLTLIYGEGNEPTTVEQFEEDYQRWFGKPLTYEEYDAGSLRSVQLSALKTTGFNQYNPTTGTANIIGGNEYQITGTYTSLTLNGEAITPDSNGKFTPTIGGVLNIVGGAANTCVHLVWSGTKDGEYEPYEEHVAPLPVTTLKGKLNGEGESVTIFPDGMKSAGAIHDEIYTISGKTYAVQRVGAVDLGSLNYSKNVSGNFVRFMTANNIDMRRSISDANAIASNGYTGGNQSFAMSARGEKKVYSYVETTIFIQDSSYTDADTFKAAMQGVVMYYELATPLVYEVDDFTLPVRYQVNDWGTEEQVQVEGVQGVAAILTCLYGVNAVDILKNLPKNYISEKSMDNLLAQLNVATNGTWTKTWNDTTKEWDFSYTPNA